MRQLQVATRGAVGCRPRDGVAILWVLVVLAVLTVLLVAITAQALTGRRWLERHANQAQALWLTRAGVELAAGRLLSNPAGYTGESAEILPDSQVRVQVRAEKDTPDTFLVMVEARYPKEPPEVVVRTLRRRLRRTVEKGQARIEVLPGERSE